MKGQVIKVLICFGTRPEIIKLAPIVRAMQRSSYFESVLCSTGQHQSMVAQMLDLFDLNLDEDLAIMRKGQTVESITTSVMSGLGKVVDRIQPDCVMVQGDTTSAFVSGLLSFYRRIPVMHLEAGLRSGDINKPWPEEANRKLLGVLANQHFAPTALDAENLLKENVTENSIHVVGNSVVNAMEYIQTKINSTPEILNDLESKFSFIEKNERFILVTGHRRESHGGGHASVFEVLRRIAEEKNIKIVFPVHLNPLIKDLANDILADTDLVHLIDPVDYTEMQYLLQRCHFVVTDSGGIQEEAPTYGKPLLVTREVTERMAGVINGSAVLVGTDAEKLYELALKLLTDSEFYDSMAQSGNPYGDGNTAQRVCEIIKSLNQSKRNKMVEVSDAQHV